MRKEMHVQFPRPFNSAHGPQICVHGRLGKPDRNDDRSISDGRTRLDRRASDERDAFLRLHHCASSDVSGAAGYEKSFPERFEESRNQPRADAPHLNCLESAYEVHVVSRGGGSCWSHGLRRGSRKLDEYHGKSSIGHHDQQSSGSGWLYRDRKFRER